MTMMYDPADPCVAINSDNLDYRELSCIYPALKPFYTSFEQFYDPIPLLTWMKGQPWIPITACIIYAVSIYSGQAYFAKRDRLNWRYSMAAWNLFLSTFSLIGMLRTAPHLLHNLVTFSLRDNMCLDPRNTYGSGSTGLWVQFFILSKFPELIDTFFIIIHKKPLIFLHWYHHITVLLYCWHSYVMTSPTGIIFTAMNYTVHATMYGYYFLMALKMKPKWFNPMIITAMQISQMMVGVTVTLVGFYFFKTDETCGLNRDNNIAAFVMYGSYLFLFCQFFFSRYFTVKSRPVKKKKV